MPDIDPEELAIVPRVNLSIPGDGRLPRAWIALLYGRVTASLAATTGVELPPTSPPTCWPARAS